MSYILEALKKSDQQRQRSAAPTLLSAPAGVVALEQPVYRFYALLATVLVGLGMLIGWLRPWHAQPASAEVDPVAVKPAVAQVRPREPFAPKLAELPPQSAPETMRMAPVPTSPVVVLRSLPALKPDQPAPPRHKTVEAGAKAEPPAVREQAAAPAASSEQRGGWRAGDLPASIQQELPRISISGIVYSGDPEGRLVGVNDQLVREGDYPAPGLRLEKIMPDGVIFSYKNYRFRREAQ